MHKWYLLQSKPRMEETAKTNLDRQGYNTYLPMVTVDRRINHARTRETMFPGYLLINLYLDTLNGDNFTTVKSTRGVARIVRFGETLAVVPDSIINSLKQRENKGLIDLGLDYNIGDKVRIKSGPFADTEAIVQAKSGLDRVKLLFHVLNRGVVIETKYSDIVPVN